MSENTTPIMTQYPAPWAVNDKGEYRDAEDKPIHYRQDITDRMIACVNACRGISDEALADDHVVKLQEDRDHLMQAMGVLKTGINRILGHVEGNIHTNLRKDTIEDLLKVIGEAGA